MILAAARIVSVLIILTLAAKAESRAVNLAAPAASLSQIPFYVAQERGFFRDEGLDVNLIVMGAPVANLALIGQNVDFSSVPTAALSAMLRGAPLRVIFNAFYRPLVWLYSKAEIHSVKELKGKRVGVAGIGSGPDHLLRELLRQNGMDPSRDVTILGLGVQSNLYTALSTGNIDASVFVIPWNLPPVIPALLNLFRSFIKTPCSSRGALWCVKNSCALIRRLWRNSFAPRPKDCFTPEQTVAAPSLF